MASANRDVADKSLSDVVALKGITYQVRVDDEQSGNHDDLLAEAAQVVEKANGKIINSSLFLEGFVYQMPVGKDNPITRSENPNFAILKVDEWKLNT